MKFLNFLHKRLRLSSLHRSISTAGYQVNQQKSKSCPSYYVVIGGISLAALITLNSNRTLNDDNTLAEDIAKSGVNIHFYNEVVKILDSSQININFDDLQQHGKPYSSYHESSKIPNIILLPKSTEDVSNIVKLCKKYHVPIVPYGGATSLEGQILTLQGGVSLDFTLMKEIVNINKNDLDITVQAGLGYIELNEYLKPLGLCFPLDPGPGATIGGMCACRCSGSTAVKYGSMRENVLNLTAVLADENGTIIKTGSRARKSSAGYDVTRLLIGSEGTLAIITEATLKLHTIPKISYSLRISFPSVKEASNTAATTFTSGINIRRCELMDDEMVKIINKVHPTMKPWIESNTLLYEITGLTEEGTLEQVEMVKDIAIKNNASSIDIATDVTANNKLWMMRKECLWTIMATYPDREPMITDVCVPLTRLAELMLYAKEAIEVSKLPCPIIAHAGDGNFHVIIMFKPDVPEEVITAGKLADDLAKKAISMEGTCTGEHGIGVGKIDLLQLEMGPGTMKVMETIKNGLDPENLLNPGKIFRNKKGCL